MIKVNLQVSKGGRPRPSVGQRLPL